MPDVGRDRLSILILAVILSGQCTAGSARAGGYTSAKVVETTAVARTIAVPDSVLGKFSLLTSGSETRKELPKTGSIVIPPGTGLYLITSYAVITNPSLLLRCPADIVFGMEMGPLEVSDETLKNISHLTNLEVLNLRDSDVTDAGLCALSKFKSLHSLDCSASNIKGTGLASLPNPEKLQNLHLAKNPVSDLSVLPKFAHLRLLDLRRCGLHNDCIDSISRLPDLETLVLSENHLSPVALAKLSALKKLSVLRVSSTGLEPKDAALFKAFKSLRLLEISGRGFDEEVAKQWMAQLPNVSVVVAKGSSSIPIEIFRPLH